MECPNLPASWNDVSVKTFIELKEIETGDFSSVLSYKMDKLFVLTETNIDSEIWDAIDTDQLVEINNKISWIEKQPSTEFKYKIGEFNFKELNALTLGEFIDLEHLFSINYISSLPEICAILYRKNKVDEWGNIEIEPRKYNEKERAEFFYGVKITEVFGVIQAYLTFKNKFLEVHENMFNEPEDLEPLDPDEEENKEDIEKEKLLTKWSWERIIFMLGNDSILNFDEVTEMPLVLVFNHLSMIKDLKI